MYLLDVNLLLALTDPMHLHHDIAHQWFAQKGKNAWATCPITENGFVRIASNPKYPNQPGSTTAVLDILRQFCSLPGHEFWPDIVSLHEKLPHTIALSHNQVTDIYLLALAQAHKGKLATLDQKIPAFILPLGDEAIEMIPV